MPKAIVGRKLGMTQIFTPEGECVAVTVVKVGREPATATIVVPGKDPVEFDAYEPLETAPEEAREYLASVWDRLGETPKKIINIVL